MQLTASDQPVDGYCQILLTWVSRNQDGLSFLSWASIFFGSEESLMRMDGELTLLLWKEKQLCDLGRRFLNRADLV